VEPQGRGSHVESTGRWAEVKLRAWWPKDLLAKVELETGRPEADPHSRVEPKDEEPRNLMEIAEVGQEDFYSYVEEAG